MECGIVAHAVSLGACRLPAIGFATLRTSRQPIVFTSAAAGAASGGERESNEGESFPSFHLKAQGNGVETLQPLQERGSVASSSDVMKLFNDAQQNMLYLNKQRLIAVEELRKAERDKELLLARIGQLEAESEASAAENDVLRRQLQAVEAKLGGGIWGQLKTGRMDSKENADPTSIYSALVLRIDSMVLRGAVTAIQAGSLKRLVLNRDTQAAEIFSSHKDDDDKKLASNLLPLLDPNRRHGLHIIHICTELEPIAKSGTLATYVAGLSCALRRRGNLVEVILPKYAAMDMDHVQNLREIQVDFYSFFGGHWHKNKIWTGVVYGVAVTFIEPLHPGGFFLRDHFYGYSDDFERFTYFCRASLDYIVKSGKQADILHLHNWQTAAVAPLFWDLFAGQGLGGTRILFTCHDFKYQCLQEPPKLALCGLDSQQLHRADRLQDNLDPRLVNILKGGIVYSNKVTTVSPVYALDVMTREHGHGLESTLITHKNKFIGIYNGLDKSLWDPTGDPHLPSTYCFENLSGKTLCKAHLKKQLGLPTSNDSVPLVGCLAPQVSDLELELIKAALDCTLMKNSQFVFMGASKIPRVQMILEDLQRDLEEKDARALVKFDESMAHLVVAASDIMVCVSVNEPTGQMPLIAMQYGSVPVTKQIRDLNGSVIDAEDISRRSEATAFTFRSARGADLMVALGRAIGHLVSDPEGWKGLMQNGMSKDFSWDAACVEEYMAAYWSIKQL